MQLTQTAVLVAQKVLEGGVPLGELKFVDSPEIQLRKRESVCLPFR
jgi:ribosome biogenesis SPOUT family RNA methylase Rps3